MGKKNLTQKKIDEIMLTQVDKKFQNLRKQNEIDAFRAGFIAGLNNADKFTNEEKNEITNGK